MVRGERVGRGLREGNRVGPPKKFIIFKLKVRLGSSKEGTGNKQDCWFYNVKATRGECFKVIASNPAFSCIEKLLS
jgi:hypothetical protein